MTQFKIASFKMPHVNASGITLGGGAWVQKGFNPLMPSTLDGIVIDPDGSLIGIDNIGITVWDNALKKVQINSAGMALFGGSNVWLPDNYDPNNQTTWNGVRINSSEIASFTSGIKRLSLSNNGIAIYGGLSVWLPANYDPNNQATWTGVVINSSGITSYSAGVMKAAINNSGMALYGGSNVWLPDNYNPSVPSTWNGVMIKDSGIQAFKAGVLTFELTSTGNAAFYGGNFSLLPANWNPSYPVGITFNSAGIKAYNGSYAMTLQIDNAGSFIFGSVVGKRFMFNGSTGVMTIEPGVVIGTVGTPDMTTVAQGAGRANTALNATADYIRGISTVNIGVTLAALTGSGVLMDAAGLRAYKAGALTLNIDASTGNAFFSGDITAASITAGGSLTLLNSATQTSTIIIGDGGTIGTGLAGDRYLEILPSVNGGTLFLGEIAHPFTSIYTTIGAGGYSLTTYNIGGTDYQAFSMSPSGVFFRYKTLFKISDYNSVERARLDAAGNLTVTTGNLVVGTSGKGIDFSAAGNAPGMTGELLDDFEKGGCTLTLTLGGASVGVTYDSRTGYYTKIGDLVTVGAYFAVSNKGTSTGAALVEGLPFVSASVWFGAASFSFVYGVTFTDILTGHAQLGVSLLVLQQNGAAAINNTNLAPGFGFIFTVSYKAA